MYTVDSECELDSIRRDAAANAGTCEGSKARASAVGGVIGFSLQPLTWSSPSAWLCSAVLCSACMCTLA